MNNFELINQTIKGIGNKIRSELFSKKSIYETYTYFSPNYRSHFLSPFLDGIIEEINNLPLDEHLVRKIDHLINGIQDSLENDPVLKPQTKTVRAQKSHIQFSISKLIEKKVAIERLLIEKERGDDYKSDSTCLSRKETALLIRYLQKANVILTHNQISDRELCKHIGSLTKISPDQIRKELVGNSWTDMTEISTKRENFDKVKSILETIISQIRSDSKPFN